VERADRLARVLLEVVEVRRLVPLVDALEDRQVQLHQVLDVVEDPADVRGPRVGGQTLRPLVGHQVHVEFRPQTVNLLGQRGPERRRFDAVRLHGQVPREVVGELRKTDLRFEREAVVDDDGLKVEVEDGRERGILERRDEDELVDERVFRPAKGLHLPARALAVFGRDGADDEYLEVRPIRARAASRVRRGAGMQRRLPAILVGRLGLGALAAVRSAQQRATDAAGQFRETHRVAAGQLLLQLSDERPGVAEERLQRPQRRQRNGRLRLQSFGVLPSRVRRRPSAAERVQALPAVPPTLGYGKNGIELSVFRRGFGFGCHVHFLPTNSTSSRLNASISFQEHDEDHAPDGEQRVAHCVRHGVTKRGHLAFCVIAHQAQRRRRRARTRDGTQRD
jgi:hypothetical protein